MTNLSLKDAAELVGVSKVALLKAIQKKHLVAVRGDNQEWLVTAAEATRYRDNRQHKTPTNRKMVIGELAQDNSQLAVVLQEKDKVIEQQNQRLAEQAQAHDKIVQGLEREMRLLADLRGQLPAETVAEIATLKAQISTQKERDEQAKIDLENLKKKYAAELSKLKNRTWWQRLTS
jgi:predicted metal-dependent hydrolase